MASCHRVRSSWRQVQWALADRRASRGSEVAVLVAHGADVRVAAPRVCHDVAG